MHYLFPQLSHFRFICFTHLPTIGADLLQNIVINVLQRGRLFGRDVSPGLLCALRRDGGPLTPQYTSPSERPGWRCSSEACAVTPAVVVGGSEAGFFFQSVWRLEKSQRARSTRAHSTVGTHRGGYWVPSTPNAVCSRSCQVSCGIKGGGRGEGWGAVCSLILLNFQISNLAVAHTSAKANVILPLNSDFTWLFLRTIILETFTTCWKYW